ncbi:polysaccharide deacetylase family protein [Anaeromicrobium sediminis]|uniref:NodB homology domain-containing protein n=1 Tax=Anaeromicrobium sediminis TaxID=1478221 RepID=A0A267MH12_9FIRM|nr:polysaccharide deacetylase family protein [Anaeromicrobium sediminis]PAB58692.1 hypothetical protein CCE28_13560 [Anaeromicrobium sediminis]
MKKIFFMSIFISLLFVNIVMATTKYGENEIPILVVNDEIIRYEDNYGEMKDNRVYVPLKDFSKAIGGKMEWNEDTKRAIIRKDTKWIEFDCNLKAILTSHNILILDSFYIKENTSMIPLRYVAEYFGYEIRYDLHENYVQVYNLIDSKEMEVLKIIKDKVKKERLFIKAEIKRKREEEARRASMEMKKYGKIVYITFDDGPGKYSLKILNILKKYNVKATFFMLSNRIKNYEDVVRSQVEYGNTIGLHGVSHNVKIIYSSPKKLVSEMQICNDALEKVTGIRTNLVRVPYGSVPYMKKPFRRAITRAGYNVWDWNVDSKDGLKLNVPPNEIIRQVKKQLPYQNQPIILFHETKSTVEALPIILDYLTKQGYIILPIESEDRPYNFWPTM